MTTSTTSTMTITFLISPVGENKTSKVKPNPNCSYNVQLKKAWVVVLPPPLLTSTLKILWKMLVFDQPDGAELMRSFPGKFFFNGDASFWYLLLVTIKLAKSSLTLNIATMCSWNKLALLCSPPPVDIYLKNIMEDASFWSAWQSRTHEEFFRVVSAHLHNNKPST